MKDERDNIYFNVLRNALYHTARRKSLERLNRIFNFLVIILGAAAMGDVLDTVGIAFYWPAFLVTLIGSAQLVFDFGGASRDHRDLQREYYNLLAEIEEQTEPKAEFIAEWRGRMFRITANEPPTLRAVDAKAFNDALDASNLFDGGERLLIPLHHRMLQGVLTFEGHTYRKLSELKVTSSG